MLTKRIIPCLDVKNGRVVKGINFENLRDIGDPVQYAMKYNQQNADELVFLDITATNEKRQIVLNLVERVAQEVFIPFTIGGGIRTVEDVREIVQTGADKVAINSAAVRNPRLIRATSEEFGSQCIVIAVDSKVQGDQDKVFINAGQKETAWETLDWIRTAEEQGAGEILLTSIDADGTKDGYDIELYNRIQDEISIPLIASGGAGDMDTFVELFDQTDADAALAASVFHSGTYSIYDVKAELRKAGVSVRL